LGVLGGSLGFGKKNILRGVLGVARKSRGSLIFVFYFIFMTKFSNFNPLPHYSSASFLKNLEAS
jgi:hypothetical protein